MLADYTTDLNRYSDGSEVWEEDWTCDYPPGYSPPNPRAALNLPPHRRTADKPGHAYRHGLLTPMYFESIVRRPQTGAGQGEGGQPEYDEEPPF